MKPKVEKCNTSSLSKAVMTRSTANHSSISTSGSATKFGSSGEPKPLIIEGFEVFCVDDETETRIPVIDIDGANEPKNSQELNSDPKSQIFSDDSKTPIVVNLEDDDDDVIIIDSDITKSQITEANKNNAQEKPLCTQINVTFNEESGTFSISNNSSVSEDYSIPKIEKIESLIKVEQVEIYPEQQHLDLNKSSIKERIRQSYIKIVRITCPVCKMMLEDSHVSDEILKHLKVHVGYYPYGCTLCDFSAAESNEVQQHSEKIHRRKLAHIKKMPESNEQKQKYEDLLQQFGKSDGVKEYFACKKCSCEFRRLDAYQRHIKVHSKILCPYCKFSCNKKRELKKHFDQFHQHLNTDYNLKLSKSHSNSDDSENENNSENVPSNKVSIAPVVHSRQFPLKFHIINKETKPTEPPPLTCPVCKKQFLVVKTALRHLRYHASYYPYKCGHCRYISMERPMVVDHLHRRHQEEQATVVLHKNMEKEKKTYIEFVNKMTKITAQVCDIENYLSGNESENSEEDEHSNNDYDKTPVKRSADVAELLDESSNKINGFPKKRRKIPNDIDLSMNSDSYKLVSSPGQSLKITFKKETNSLKNKSKILENSNSKHPFLLACKICGYATYVADLYQEHSKVHENLENDHINHTDPNLLHCSICDYATYVADLHNEHVRSHEVSKTLSQGIQNSSSKRKIFSVLKNIEAHSATLSALFKNCTPELTKDEILNESKELELDDESAPLNIFDNQQKEDIKLCTECQKPVSASHFYFHLNTKYLLLPFKCLYCKFRYSSQKVVSNHILSKHKDHPICVTYESYNTQHRSGTTLICFCIYCDYNNSERNVVREHIKESHGGKPVRVKIRRTVLPLTSLAKAESKNLLNENGKNNDEKIFDNEKNGFDSELESKKIEPLRIRKISSDFAFVKNSNGIYDSIAFTDNPTVKCPLCKQFILSKIVKQHLRKHFGIMRFQCKYCSFLAMYKFIIQQHILKKHPGSRINVIDTTSSELEFKEKLMKEFIEESMLCINSSAENIDDILLFQCPACSFTTPSKTVWFKHKKVHFSTMTIYRCAYCDLSFSETSKTRSHCRNVHIPKLLKIIELTEIKAILGNNPKYCRFRTLFAKGLPRIISNWSPHVKLHKLKSLVCNK